MGKQRNPEQLAKFLDYVLARRPDEFGLVPDTEGFIKIKELLKALNEEDGWRYVRLAQINEVFLTQRNKVIEIQENRIRATNRQQLAERQVASNLPKLLYTFVRRRAYPVVLEKGIMPFGRGKVVLSADKKTAHRMGKRIDAAPIILTVSVQKMHDAGAIFLSTGGTLFLTKTISPACFTGPSLPKEKTEIKAKESTPTISTPKQPGSFFPVLDSDINKNSQNHKKANRKKGADWKKDRKKLIKIKRKTGLPF
jgi:putative RNA 2'-phosphotransferase